MGSSNDVLSAICFLNIAVPAFRDVMDVPLVVRRLHKPRKEVWLFLCLFHWYVNSMCRFDDSGCPWRISHLEKPMSKNLVTLQLCPSILKLIDDSKEEQRVIWKLKSNDQILKLTKCNHYVSLISWILQNGPTKKDNEVCRVTVRTYLLTRRGRIIKGEHHQNPKSWDENTIRVSTNLSLASLARPTNSLELVWDNRHPSREKDASTPQFCKWTKSVISNSRKRCFISAMTI